MKFIAIFVWYELSLILQECPMTMLCPTYAVYAILHESASGSEQQCVSTFNYVIDNYLAAIGVHF